MPAPNSFVAVNQATNPGKKLATYEFVDGGDVLESEAITMTDGTGQEMIGPRLAADSLPVTLATDEPAIPVAPVKCTTTTVTAIAGTVVSTTLLAANPNRLGFTIANASMTDTLFVLLSSAGPASPTLFSVPIVPGGFYEDSVNYVGDVLGVWTGATGSALVTEFTP